MILSKIKQLTGWWFNRHQPLIDKTMCIKLGLHTVDGEKVYHLTDKVLEIEKVYDTKGIKREVTEGSDKYHIELIAEKSRVASNMTLLNGIEYPSRYTCLYVCDKEFVQVWYRHLVKWRKRQFRVYEISLTGVLLGTYADYLKAEMYWEASPQPTLNEKEGLFEGTYKVIRECDINEFPQ